MIIIMWTFLFGLFLLLPFPTSAQTVIGIVNTILDQIIRPFVRIMMVAATLFFVWGIIEYVAKSDSEEGRSTGRQHMMWGIIGLVIMFSAVAFIEILKSFWEGV